MTDADPLSAFQLWLSARGHRIGPDEAAAALWLEGQKITQQEQQQQAEDQRLAALAYEYRDHEERKERDQRRLEIEERHTEYLGKIARNGNHALMSLAKPAPAAPQVVVPPPPAPVVNLSIPEQPPPTVNIDLADLASVFKAMLVVMERMDQSNRLLTKALEKVGQPIVNIPKGEKPPAPADLSPLVDKLAEILKAVTERKPMKVETDGKGNVTRLVPEKG